MYKFVISIIIFFISLINLYSDSNLEIDYAELTKLVNKIRREVGVSRINQDIHLVELAKLQVEEMIKHNAMEHSLVDKEITSELRKKIANYYGAKKSYIEIEIWELIAAETKFSNKNIEETVAHVYDNSSRHFSVITSDKAVTMGWYVAEADDLLWISTYVLLRYYK